MSKREFGFFAAILLLLSTEVYLIHFLIFRDPHHIFIYLTGDLAFLFTEVLLVTLVIDRLLRERERRATEHKMNMVIGAFFSAMGYRLLSLITPLVERVDEIRAHLAFGPDCTEAEIRAALQYVHNTPFSVQATPEGLQQLGEFLEEQRDLLLRLLENPVLLEHGNFTDLLWALSHVSEELTARCDYDLMDLPASDLEHIAGDIERTYTHLIGQWVRYMRHLQVTYPFLFSLAMRTNPLRPDACPLVNA